MRGFATIYLRKAASVARLSFPLLAVAACTAATEPATRTEAGLIRITDGRTCLEWRCLSYQERSGQIWVGGNGPLSASAVPSLADGTVTRAEFVAIYEATQRIRGNYNSGSQD